MVRAALRHLATSKKTRLRGTPTLTLTCLLHCRQPHPEQTTRSGKKCAQSQHVSHSLIRPLLVKTNKTVQQSLATTKNNKQSVLTHSSFLAAFSSMFRAPTPSQPPTPTLNPHLTKQQNPKHKEKNPPKTTNKNQRSHHNIVMSHLLVAMHKRHATLCLLQELGHGVVERLGMRVISVEGHQVGEKG